MQDIRLIYNNQLYFYISDEQFKNGNKKTNTSNDITCKRMVSREDKILNNKFNKEVQNMYFIRQKSSLKEIKEDLNK